MLSHTTNFSGRPNVVGKMPFAPASASHGLADFLEMRGAMMSFPRNAEIYGENEPTEFLYKLVSGTVRTSKVLNDGRRQIGDFYMPGDLFGYEADDEHAYSAEAISPVKVIVVKRSAIEALAARDNYVAGQLWAMTSSELQRMREHILLLIKTAQARVAGFLLEMADRIKTANEIELPMSRQDIADYLGLTIETVSRTLSTLEKSAVIEVPSARRIVLHNRAALVRLNA